MDSILQNPLSLFAQRREGGHRVKPLWPTGVGDEYLDLIQRGRASTLY